MGSDLHDAAEAMKLGLRGDLREAMRAKEALRTPLLRSLIAALDNAQAVPPGELVVAYRIAAA